MFTWNIFEACKVIAWEMAVLLWLVVGLTSGLAQFLAKLIHPPPPDLCVDFVQPIAFHVRAY